MKKDSILTTLKPHRQLLPLVLLAGFCVEAIVKASLHTSMLTTKHYLGFGALVVNLLTYVVLRKYYKYTLLLTLVAGLFNLLCFSAGQWGMSLSVNKFGISLQPQAFFAALLAYLINVKRVNEYLLTKHTSEDRELKAQEVFSDGVEKFKDRYRSYSTEALAEIVAANKYVPQALEAARQLLNERQAG